MKKLCLLAMALALVLTMTQCKKENTTTSNDEGIKVPITLNVSGNGGSRVDVTTGTGVVTFENGDVIHVSSNGTYVGTLTYNGTQFAGEINEPTEGQKLQFYFLGNKTPEFNADSTECSVVISDQTEYLPVISLAPSRENYQIGKTNYNATLYNSCALVKFNVTTSSDAATCILGMKNKVTVSFTPDFFDEFFSYSMDGEGIIQLEAGSGEKWAILLPQDGVEYPSAFSSDGAYTGVCGSIPHISENQHLKTGIPVTVTTPVSSLNGVFTVNNNGNQVYFSQGNLQYIGSAATPYWKFADNQWDYFGATTGQYSTNENVDRDLFGWGTSGYNHGAVCYQPWSTSTNNYDYNVYGEYTYNLYDQTGQADWGYNAIANGGNQENSGWRTLTADEWHYVFDMRVTASGIRWVGGIVNGKNGIILLPDNWMASVYTLNDINGGDDEWELEYENNTISAEDWVNVLEMNGAIFLPAANSRTGTSGNPTGMTGYYWTASYSSMTFSIGIIFSDSAFPGFAVDGRRRGFAVRLVRDVE